MGNTLRFHPEMPGDACIELAKVFDTFVEKYKKIFQNEVYIKPGIWVEINWACIWNNPRSIGQSGVVLCSNNQFCVVQFKGKERPTDFYRCEDVTPILKQATHG